MSDLQVTIVNNPKTAQRMIDALQGDVSFDIETTCLYPWQQFNDKGEPAPARIHTFGFGTERGEFTLRTDDWDPDELDVLIGRCVRRLKHCCVIMQNGKFDVVWMRVHYGVRIPLHFDTMLADYIIDENRWHDLESIAQRYCGAKKWDVPLKVKQGMKDRQKLAEYHCLDLHWTRQIAQHLRRDLAKDPKIERVFKRILMPLSDLFIDVEYDGVVVDETKFDQAETFLRGIYDARLADLKKHGDINWASPKEVGTLLFKTLKIKPPLLTKKGAPSTSESALNMIDHPCVSDLIKFRGAKQQLSFFIDGWRPFLHRRRVNGKWVAYLHPSFKLGGTVTGRPSCEHPNLQQVPRDPRIRTLITAEDGWVLVEVDLSQIELRIAAELSRDPALLDAFLRGIDVHWLTAIREIERGGAAVSEVINTALAWRTSQGKKPNKRLTYSEAIADLLEMGPDVAAKIDASWKEYRKKAKAVNFGYLYGMWWKKFKMYARDNYGVEITDKQAEASRKFFFETYRGLTDWHSRQKAFARRNGYVRSLSGRKRRLPLATLPEDCPARGQAERQAINSPVQSFGAELNLMTALQMREEFGERVRICGTVHDAILFRVRKDDVHKIVPRVLEIMRRPQLMDEFDIDFTVPILGEAKVGAWGAGVDLKEYKG